MASASGVGLQSVSVPESAVNVLPETLTSGVMGLGISLDEAHGGVV